MEHIEPSASEALEQPRRRTDYVFGVGDRPPSDWHYAVPLLPVPDVKMTSYADEIAQAAR